MKIIVLILCLIPMNYCAIVQVNELPSSAIQPEIVEFDSENGNGNGKRAVRQVGVNVGPIGVGVGPFGGVGVRIGRLFNLSIPPSYYPVAYQPVAPVAYPVAFPVAYPAPAPVSYPGEYSYSSNYCYSYYN